MNDKSAFLDTNVLIYAYSATNLAKRTKAIDVMKLYTNVISLQVLSEFCNVCIKKLHFPVSEVRGKISEILETCELFLLDDETIEHALTVQEQYGFSYYDSQIIAVAIECKCSYLFSEDLQDGQVLDGVIVKNVFLDIGSAISTIL